MFDIQNLHINQELVKYHVIFFKYFSGAYMTVSSNTAKGLKKYFLKMVLLYLALYLRSDIGCVCFRNEEKFILPKECLPRAQI